MSTDRIPVADLSYGVLDEISRTIDWQEAAGEDGDGFDWYEAFEYSHDGEEDLHTHELVLVANRSSVVAAFLPDGTRVDVNDGSDYWQSLELPCVKCGATVTTDDDGETWVDETDGDACPGPATSDDDAGVHQVAPGVLREVDLDKLREVEPYMHGAEGPMMNYWYSLGDDRSGFGSASIGGYGHSTDEIGAAYRLRNVPLCLVEVDETFGLALTGGGMDLTWEIVSAFTLLGYLPPAAFCRPPGFEHRDQDYLVAAMHRTLTSQVERYRRDVELLVDKYPALATGAS